MSWARALLAARAKFGRARVETTNARLIYSRMDQMAQKAGRLALRLDVLSREQLCVLAAAGCAQVTQVLAC